MRFFQETALPSGSLAPDSFYLILNGDFCETYVTDNAGVAKLVGNTAMINELVAQATSSLSALQIVSDIDARTALNLTANTLVLVTDASADDDVDSGAALFAYNVSDSSYSLVAEYESLDQNLILNWDQIQGGPSSTPTAIDSAVAASHTHVNATQLDLISGTAEQPTYAGNNIAIQATDNW